MIKTLDGLTFLILANFYIWPSIASSHTDQFSLVWNFIGFHSAPALIHLIICVHKFQRRTWAAHFIRSVGSVFLLRDSRPDLHSPHYVLPTPSHQHLADLTTCVKPHLGSTLPGAERELCKSFHACTRNAKRANRARNLMTARTVAQPLMLSTRGGRAFNHSE